MSLFEVGVDYKIVTLECSLNADGKQAYYENDRIYEVAEVDGTLIKLLGPDFASMTGVFAPSGIEKDWSREEFVLNTASLFFLRAEKVRKPG